MDSKAYKHLEFLLIFILAPISFVFSFSIWIKLAIGGFGFAYVIYVLLKVEKEKFKITPYLNWKKFWKETLVKLLVIAIITALFVYLTNKETLFSIIKNKPKLWVFILFLYSFFSVYPQELIYRTFFFKRYTNLFNSEKFLILINALVFSIGHIFFKNILVMVLTFLGGVLFAFTFCKTKSTLLVTIEHAIYGSWLFTVGMGNILGFPS